MPNGPWLDVLALARRGGSWCGRLALAGLPRLGSLAGASSDGQAEVAVRLSFGFDGSGRVRVTGECAADAVVACSRCAEDVPVRLAAAVDTLLVRSEAEASTLIADHDVIVAPTREVGVAELIEDDLLLSIPETGCDAADDCPNAPPMEYAADAGEAVPVRASPFEALAVLKGEV